MSDERLPYVPTFYQGLFPPTDQGRLNWVGQYLDPPFVKLLRTGRELTIEQQDAFTQNLYAHIRQQYGLDRIEDPALQIGAANFLFEQLKHANTFVNSCRYKIGADENTLTLNNEVAYYSDKGVDRFVLAAGDLTSKELRFEVWRQLFLAELFGHLNARLLRNRSASRLYSLQTLLNRELWAGEIGETFDLPFFTIHDPDSNGVTADPTFIKPESQSLTQGQHIKKHVYKARYLQPRHNMDIDVTTHPRHKEDFATVAKALYLARTKPGDYPNPRAALEDIKDILGLGFVVCGSRDQTIQFADLVASIVKAGQPETEIIADDDIDHRPSQNPKVWFVRRLVQYPDGEQIELKFEPFRDHEQAQWEIGNYDPETGSFSGQAHKLYALRRITPLLPVIFPEEIYPSADIPNLISTQYQRLAEELRTANVV